MVKMVIQYGVTVATQRQVHLRRHLAGAMKEMEQGTLEAGVNTLKRPREDGIHPALPHRTLSPSHGAGL